MNTARKVKIFGERNTCTNALKLLIESNSNSRVLPSIAREVQPRLRSKRHKMLRKIMGEQWNDRRIDQVFATAPPTMAWKHCSPNFNNIADFKGVLVLLTVRNPYSWLRALHKRPYHHTGTVPKSFSEFVTSSWHLTLRDRIDTHPITPIKLYNVKLESHLRFHDRVIAQGTAVKIIKFEDFVIDQLSIIEQLRPYLDGLIENPQIISKAAKSRDKLAGRDASYYKEYYGNERWKADIDSAARSKIDNGINWDTAKRAGYEQWKN